MDIVINFKQDTRSLGTRRYSSEAILLPRIGEDVVMEEPDFKLSGKVISIGHYLTRKPTKEVWVVVECK